VIFSIRLVPGLVSVLMFAATLSLTGCDDGGPGELVPLTGVVLLDGTPVSDVSLTLVPQIGVQGRGGYAKSTGDGSFEFQTSPEDMGVSPGKYRVLFQKYAMPDGSPIPPNTSAADAGLVNEMPALYSNPETSPVFAEVSTDATEPLRFELESRPKR